MGVRVITKQRYIGVGVFWLSLHSLLKQFFARLVVDIKLIALVAMPVLGYSSTEFERERKADSAMHQCSM